MLVIRMRLAGEAEAARFFDGYSELLEKKHSEPHVRGEAGRVRFSFETPGGGAFIRCVARDCLLWRGSDARPIRGHDARPGLAAGARRSPTPHCRACPAPAAFLAIPRHAQTDSLSQLPAAR